MKIVTLSILILGAALSRWIPHAPNVTAITALALLGGAMTSSRLLTVLMPVAALLISDLLIGFHDKMLFVYVATALIALMAHGNLKSSTGYGKLAGASFCASSFFFIVTNFGVWIMDSIYPSTAAGLMKCYWMALPFFGNQVLGDLAYTAVIFGAYKAVLAYQPQWIKD